VPLVVGKYCFSDWGYKNNKKKAYLGNRRFDYYERQNDVILAACAPYGKGKIMVCGDTSAFHNTTFMTTYPFVVNVFNYLSSANVGLSTNLQNILKASIVISIIGSIVLFFISIPNILLPLTFILLISSVIFFTGFAERKSWIRDIPSDRLKIAYIDYSHKGRFDLMSWGEESIGGLKNNLMRNGFHPFLLREFRPEKLMQAKVLIIIAPTKPFINEEVTALKDFMRNGGKVLLSVGWEEKEASVPLLKSFGLDIDNVPLARCVYDYDKYQKTKKRIKNRKRVKKKIQFREAWPVIFEPKDEIQIICKPLDYPVVIRKKFGKGFITVIADSKFLLNQNLEGDEKYFVPNMFLLRDLLLR